MLGLARSPRCTALCFPVVDYRAEGDASRPETVQLPTAGRLGRATRARARVSLRNHTYLVQEINGDPQGRSPRVRPFHCTPVGLTFAIAPNVGDSGTLFLSVGSCVRARPRPKRKPKNRPSLSLASCTSIRPTWAAGDPASGIQCSCLRRTTINLARGLLSLLAQLCDRSHLLAAGARLQVGA